MREQLEENISYTQKNKQQIHGRDDSFYKHSKEESSEHIYKQRKETSMKEILKDMKYRKQMIE